MSVPAPLCLKDGLMPGDRQEMGRRRSARRPAEPQTLLPLHPRHSDGGGPDVPAQSVIFWKIKAPLPTHGPYHAPCGTQGKGRIKVVNRGRITEE